MRLLHLYQNKLYRSIIIAIKSSVGGQPHDVEVQTKDLLPKKDKHV